MRALLHVWLLIAVAATAYAKEKEVTDKWTWFTNYYYFSSEWTLNAEVGRQLEVGLGISVFGKPRGGIHKFSQYYTFTAYGAGAIKVRVIDGKGPCMVRLDGGKVEAIPLYGDPSLVGAAIDDANKARGKAKAADNPSTPAIPSPGNPTPIDGSENPDKSGEKTRAPEKPNAPKR